MTIDLSWATAETIASGLESARATIDDSAGSVPSGVDGGEATALITQMVARVAESAAGLSEGLGAASSKVRSSTASFLNADLASQQSFQLPTWGE